MCVYNMCMNVYVCVCVQYVHECMCVYNMCVCVCVCTICAESECVYVCVQYVHECVCMSVCACMCVCTIVVCLGSKQCLMF